LEIQHDWLICLPEETHPRSTLQRPGKAPDIILEGIAQPGTHAKKAMASSQLSVRKTLSASVLIGKMSDSPKSM
jgi:hypothetical protein